MHSIIIKRIFYILLILGALYWAFTPAMTTIGNFLIKNNTLSNSDAVIVLTTGVDYYPRLTEAAQIYKQGLTKKVIINGNRKSDTLRKIEAMGFNAPCHWSEKFIQMLAIMGVPRDKVIVVNGEDIFDTVSEAKVVGEYAHTHGMKDLTIVTSKFHTRRAGYIWEHVYPNRFSISVAAAKDDPFNPAAWWKSGRQIRSLLGEYGGWFYYFWHA